MVQTTLAAGAYALGAGGYPINTASKVEHLDVPMQPMTDAVFSNMTGLNERLADMLVTAQGTHDRLFGAAPEAEPKNVMGNMATCQRDRLAQALCYMEDQISRLHSIICAIDRQA